MKGGPRPTSWRGQYEAGDCALSTDDAMHALEGYVSRLRRAGVTHHRRMRGTPLQLCGAPRDEWRDGWLGGIGANVDCAASDIAAMPGIPPCDASPVLASCPSHGGRRCAVGSCRVTKRRPKENRGTPVYSRTIIVGRGRPCATASPTHRPSSQAECVRSRASLGLP